MVKEIANTPFYKITTDAEKNRIYLSIIGSWKTANDVPAYLDDWKKTLANIKPGFTILSDLTHMATARPEINELHQKAQKMLNDAGLTRTAEVLTEEAAATLKLQLNTISSSSNMSKATFIRQQDAEAWLDKE